MASPVAEADANQPAAVDYPERHWIAQSVGHGDAVRLATAALEHRFRHGASVLVAKELAVYYEQGNSLAWPRPDVQMAFGGGVATAACSTCGRKARPRTFERNRA